MNDPQRSYVWVYSPMRRRLFFFAFWNPRIAPWYLVHMDQDASTKITSTCN